MKYVLFLVMVLFSGQAVALECVKQPTCEELNYSKEDDPACKDDGYILCPFDFSYKKCAEFDCAKLGFTKSEKSSWCGKISYCLTDKSYSACVEDIPCADGYTKEIRDVNTCGETGALGWALESYSQNPLCKKCTPKTCSKGSLFTDISECSFSGTKYAELVETESYAGNEACKECVCHADEAKCPWNKDNVGENGQVSGEVCCNGNSTQCQNHCQAVVVPDYASTTETCSACGQTVPTAWECHAGYTRVDDICQPSQCLNNGSTSQDLTECLKAPFSYLGTKYASRIETGQYSGTEKCYTCSCDTSSAYSACTWDESKRGANGTLEDPCCNGKYATCNTTCAPVTVPDYATGKDYCDGCGKSGYTGWDCNNGYYASGTSCLANTCDGYNITVCPTHAQCGDCQSGEIVKKQVTSCDNYWTPNAEKTACVPAACLKGDTSSDTANCYSGLYGATKTPNGYYSGNSPCYECQCNVDAICTWDNDNKGEGTLGTQCCNDKYKDCTDNTTSVTVPENATCTSPYSVCQENKCKSWVCKDGYILDDDKCIKSCVIGDVFYADGSCGDVNNYTQGSGKIPVGVVYWVSDEGKHGKVINLKDLGREATNKPFDPANPYDTRYELYWGYYDYDVEKLTNYDYTNMLTQLQSRDEDLYDGKGNTDKILAAQEPRCSYEYILSSYYKYCVPQAARAARDFYPLEGLENDLRVGQGRWYLPAIGELMDLYGYDNSLITKHSGTSGAKGDHKTLVNNTLDALKGKGVSAEKLTDTYSSSSEAYRTTLWGLNMDTGNRYTVFKSDQNCVRVSLQF